MKSRSHRMPTINNEPPDDWGDGSWTVDCVCGVNFDDGEEMVNCDECGVWVHTRCSRYIKGETSFACDKCKGRKSSRSNNHNVNEEEVAQLLVELPTKTLNMDRDNNNNFSNNNNCNYYPPPVAPPKSSLRLWTEIPIEERVHVHGVPGGDPGLFKGISSVFTSELWKCSGYVPKKFNFKYREFPCWDDEKVESVAKIEEESVNPVDDGADALFSLSKEIVSGNPVEMLVGLRGSVENASREKNLAKKEGKKRESSYSSVGYAHDGARKDSNDFHPSGLHLGKRKKDSGRTKDIIAKKKARSLISKDAVGKRRVSTTTVGAQVDSLKVKVGESKNVGTDIRRSISGDKSTLDSVSGGSHHRLKNILTVNVNHAEESVKKVKPKDSLAADIDHIDDSLKKLKPRDTIAASAGDSLKKAKHRDTTAAISEDSFKKAKHRISAETSTHHTGDLSRKVKVKDKLLAKSRHSEDLSKKVKLNDNLAAYGYHGENRTKDAWRNSSLVEIVVKSENDHQDPTRTGNSSETVAVEVSLLDPNGISPIKRYKDRNLAVDGSDCVDDGKHDSQDVNGNISDAAFSSVKLNPPVRETNNVAIEVQEGQIHHDANEGMLASSLRSGMKVKTEANDVHPEGSSNSPSSLIDVKLDGAKHLNQHLKISVSDQPYENHLVHETHSSSSPSVELAVTESKPLICREKANIVEGMIPISGEPCENREVGSVGTLSLQESASKSKLLKNVEEPLKTGAINPRPPSPVSQRKVVPGFGKSSFSSTGLVGKSEASGSCKPPGRPASPSTLRPIHFTKRVKPNAHADFRKDHAVMDTIKDDSDYEEPRNVAREQLKSSAACASKSSHLSRDAHASASECNSSDATDSMLQLSSKAAVAQNVTDSSVPIESISKLESDTVPQVQSKTTASGLPEKVERFNHSGSHPLSKATHSSSMHPPPPVNSSSTLSDEELALLLHQELNSSPRVPRVPRMRQASGNPQPNPPTATSMLIKRASSSGAKDHILFSRRKNKEEAPKDASRNSREPIDEKKKINGVLSSHDHRRQDQGIAADASTRKEAPSGSPEMGYTAKRNSPLSSTTFGQSSSIETIDQNLRSLHKSPRTNSDDDYNDNSAGSAGPPTRTLPGLLDEIMSKGRRMTYEELCNAVLPHWNNLRKHNGERYAYSSHSQAVLDCLRNRNEWAQLVDRGPKTTAGRKKRKIVSELHTAEQEENGYGKSRATRESAAITSEAHPEDFPKGKRKARKRRRLSLQGRGIKDIRKGQKANAVTDEEEDEDDEDNDGGPFSPSSDGGIFSEDSQGAKARATASEASSSFEDVGSL